MSALVSHYMQRKVISITTEATLEQAGRVMTEYSVGALLVVRKDHHVGIISEERLAREGTAKGLDPDTTRVASIMRKNLLSIESDQTLRQAQALMKAKGVRHLVVTEAGKVVGILALSGLTRL